MQKLNEYTTTDSDDYEFMGAWQIWKTFNIAALIIIIMIIIFISVKTSYKPINKITTNCHNIKEKNKKTED